MNPILTKSLIGVGLAGVSVAGGYGIYSHLSSSQTLEDLLKRQNLTILKTEGNADDKEWEKKVDSFKSNSGSSLEGYKHTDDQKDKNVEAMKVACRELLGTSIKEKTEEKENQAKQWCTIAKTQSNG